MEKLRDITDNVLAHTEGELEGISAVRETDSNERPIDELEEYFSKLSQRCISYLSSTYRQIIKKLKSLRDYRQV